MFFACHIACRVVSSKPARWIFFGVLVVCFTLWLVKGLSWTHSHSPEKKAQRQIEAMTKQLQDRDPDAADVLARQARQHETNALAATMIARQNRDGYRGLLDLARSIRQEGTSNDLFLAEMALCTPFASSTDREAFLSGHLTALEQSGKLGSLTNNTTIQKTLAARDSQYRSTLAAAAQDENLWRTVRDNPVMVFLLQNVNDRDSLEFYHRERDWLDDVLYVCLTGQQETSQAPSAGQCASDLLTTARKNHPLFHDALDLCTRQHEPDAQETASGILSVFALFSNYGDIIRSCVNHGKIPLEECMSVLFANQEYFEEHVSDKPEVLASRLVNMRNTMPALWQLASQRLFFLKLGTDVPEDANVLAQKFGTDDIALFLYTKYPECIPQAARAVVRFGDLGIYILNRYEKSKVFREKLTASSLGVRIIPYTATFGDAGLERIAENEAWLDRYFDESGNPRESRWWASMPIGSVVNVAKNWAAGYPCEWDELGWAALDVADVSLLALTFGASAPASAAKASATTGARLGARELSRRATVVLARKGEQTLIQKGTRQAAKTALASPQRRSLMRTAWSRTAGHESLRLARVVRAGKTYYACSVALVTSPVRQVLLSTWQAARSSHAVWQGVSPTVRRAVYRSLLYVGLATTIIFHTVPELVGQFPQIAEKLGTFAGEVVQNAAESGAIALNSCLNKLLSDVITPSWIPYIVYSVGALLLAGMCLALLRGLLGPKRRSAFVG